MYYFAYGSNMSIARLKERTPSAVPLGCYLLKEHDLRFHKSGRDGSGKCDAYFTSNSEDAVYGALFEIDAIEKPALDMAEGLGRGYEEKYVTVIASNGLTMNATTYIATAIDESLSPYSWYLNHVLIGARETPLPAAYVQKKIIVIEAIEDNEKERDARQRSVHCS